MLYNLPDPSNASKDSNNLANIRSYIDETHLPTLTAQVREALESPFTTTEIQDTIKTLKTWKCTGPYGFSLKFYKLFSLELA